jgi:hypothetical protein
LPKVGSLRADLRHVSAPCGVAASQLGQRERKRWPGDGIRSAGGAQRGDHVRTADGVAHATSREAPGLRHRADDDHVGEVEHARADVLIGVLDVRLIEQQ